MSVEQQQVGQGDPLALATSDELDRLTERVEKVLELHAPYWVDGAGVRHDHTVMVLGDEAPEGHICRIGLDGCSRENEEHSVLACTECGGDGDEEQTFQLHPCRTRRLLLGERHQDPARAQLDRAVALEAALDCPDDDAADHDWPAWSRRGREHVEDGAS